MNGEHEERVEQLQRRQEEAAAAQREAADEERVRHDMSLSKAASKKVEALEARLNKLNCYIINILFSDCVTWIKTS